MTAQGNPGAGFSIRPVSRDDHANWRVLFEGYNAFYGRSGPTALPEQVVQTTWQRLLDPNEPMHALVAESSAGRLLGLAHYLFHRSTIQIARMVYMQDLFTSPDSRGMGVGRALIESVYSNARDAGCPRVYWHTYESNATARALYDKLARFEGAIVYRQSV